MKKILAGVLQETGVALAAHDLVVDAPRLFARADFADEPAVAVPDGELCDRSGLRDRKKVCAFEYGVRIVAKDLLDVRGRHLRGDLRVEFDRTNRERARQLHGARRARAIVADARHNDALRGGKEQTDGDGGKLAHLTGVHEGLRAT